MGIRIDAVTRYVSGANFSWHLRAKGYDGLGIHFSCWTGVDGAGLSGCCDGRRVVEELLTPDMFHVHARCTAEQVVHRVVAAFVMIGWGPEYIDDPASISGGRAVASRVVKVASMDDLVRHPL